MELRARCDLCTERDACAADGGLRPNYPACHRPLRRTSLERARALFTFHAKRAGLDPARTDALVDLVLERHARDRERYSEVLELSVKRVGDEERAFRFSYALPGARQDRAGTDPFVLAFARPFGDAALAVFARGLECLGDPRVAMPLVGVEWAGGSEGRAKMYLQIVDGAGPSGFEVAERWLGVDGLRARHDGAQLHMVGVDVDRSGVLGAKLYLAAPGISLERPPFDGAPVACALREAGLDGLVDALRIERIDSNGRAVAGREIDFGLAPNEVPWRRIGAALAPLQALPRTLVECEASFRLAVRRLSFDTARGNAMTVYYALAEEDGAKATRPLLPIARGLTDKARRLLAPLLDARPGPSGFRLHAWDAEQGISVAFARKDRFVLIELEPRDDARPAFATTRHYRICARAEFTPTGELTPEERTLVDGFVRFVRGREHLAPLDERPAPSATEVREVRAERVLVPEGDGRYYLNPYAGCMIGCSFCFVAPRAEMSRRLEGAPPPAWGRWVDVKIDAPEVLAREVTQYPPGLVRISPLLTDPYQPIERRYRITRQCLEILIRAGFRPAILTRESRALDDLDLLAGARGACVGYSIPTDDERLRRAFEPGSDELEHRFDALRRFAEAGVATCVVVQPALPMDVERFVARVAPWVRAARVDGMHFAEGVADRYAAAGIQEAASPEHQAELLRRLREAFTAAGVPLDERDDLAGMLSD